jgi:DNA-binding HxlR family transcriptional regulator
MEHKEQVCQFKLMASRDALEVIQGKWRIPIIISLTYGNKRFGEIQRDIEDISPKMLSQELKSLEMNKIIKRTLYDTMPVTTEYSLTPLGQSMNNLLKEILNWGIHFRKEVVGK